MFDVAAVRLREVVRVAEAQRIVVAFLVLGHRIEGRRVPGLALFDGFFGSADGVVAGQ
ncbi:hypothetical protein D3C84_1201790 [compost metagenome]